MADRAFDYLIIGNSAAGVTAAEQIRALDEAASVAIVSREPHPAYGRPLISYLIEGKTTLDAIGLKAPGFYEEQRIDALLGPDYEVVELRPEAHEAVLADGSVLTYGSCLLATGSIPFVPPIEGLGGKDNVYGFMTLDDALALWDEARAAAERAHAEGRLARAIVIGAGLIGLKAAEALSHQVDEVLVLELAPRILPAVLDAEGAGILQGILADHGNLCRPGVSVERVLGDGARAEGAVLTDGASVDCDLVVAAVGVRPNTALAAAAGAAQGRGLVCDDRLRTSLPDVYAAGDVVQVTDVLDGSERPLALWPNAMRQGRIAGRQMAGAPDAEPFEGSFAVNAVDFFDASLLTAGVINPAEDSGCTVEVTAEGDRYAKFVRRDGCLVGYILLNRPANAGIYTALIEQRVPLDTLDPAIFDEAPANLDFPADVRWERLHKCYPADRDSRGWKERD